MKRYAMNRDTSQPLIVSQLRDAGVEVWIIGQPCDLLVRFWSNTARSYLWLPVECKTPYGKKSPRARLDKRQEAQIEFLDSTKTPVVTTAEEALAAIRASGGAV
jgi:hypothetical protein